MPRNDVSTISTVASRDSLESIASPEKRKPEFVDEKQKRQDSTRSASYSYAERVRRAGLDQLATHMVESRGRSSALFRRFDKANVRALLEMEREIAELEAEVEREEDKRVVDEELVGRLGGDLRRLIREYYETVLLTKEVMALSRPTAHSLNHTRCAFPPDHGQSDFILAKYHNPNNFPDLCSVAPSSDSDLLSRVFERFAEGSNITHIITFLSALCAVFFLVGGMVGLYFVESMRARLGLVGMFTVLFAAVIAGATEGKRHEVFVATAAYAAVLVVFVSGNIAANPAPTECRLTDPSGNAVAADANVLSTAGSATLASAATAATVTAVETSTFTLSETGSMRTIVSAVTTTISPTPTVIMKKGEMSGLAKTGIGVGAAIGAIFVLMLLGWTLVWISKQTWFGREGVFAMFARSKARNGRGNWTGDSKVERKKNNKARTRDEGRSRSRGGNQARDEKVDKKGKQRERVASTTRMKEKDAHAAWV